MAFLIQIIEKRYTVGKLKDNNAINCKLYKDLVTSIIKINFIQMFEIKVHC